MQPSDIKIISERTLFKGKWRKLEEIVVQSRKQDSEEFGGPMTVELTSRKPAVICLPYIAETDEIILNRQLRYGVLFNKQANEDPYIYEICAGLIDDGEDPKETALRELEEETGCHATDIEFIIKSYASPGYDNEVFHFFCANIEKAKSGIFGEENEGENIKTYIMPAAKAIEMADKGEILSAPAVLALNWFARNHERLKNKWGNK